MRHITLILLPVALASVPLAAQNFEGTVALRLNGTQSMTWKIKGERSQVTTGTAVAGRTQMRTIIDRDAKTSTMLMPLPGGLPGTQGVEGIKIVAPMDAESEESGSDSSFTMKKLGTSQTIAGLKCDDYEVSDSLATHLCLTTALGSFMLPSAVPGLGSLMGGGGGLMPLRSLGGDGSAPAVFSIPGGRVIVSGDGSTSSMGAVVATSPMTAGGAGGGAVAGTSSGTTTGTIVMGGSPGGAAAGGTTTAVMMNRGSADGTRQVITMGPGGGTVTTIGADGKSTTVPLAADATSGSSTFSTMPGGGGMQTMRINAGPPAWVKALKNNGFPLKVWVPGGKVLLETTTVTRGPISDENFVAPAGYVDPSELGAMMRGGAGGGN
jgi:hypothetical protein